MQKPTKKQLGKRAFSILLAAVMLFSCVDVTALAAAQNPDAADEAGGGIGSNR